MIGIETMYENSKKTLYYLTHIYGYNNFLVDDVNEELVKQLSIAIQQEDKMKAIRLYLKIDKEMDLIRDRYCYNNPELPYRSSFRQIAKDVYRELKIRHLINHDDVRYIAYILRFISTSDYFQIREMLIKKSLSMYMYWDIPLNPEDFPGGYIPLEAIMDYCIRIANIYIRWEDKNET